MLSCSHLNTNGNLLQISILTCVLHSAMTIACIRICMYTYACMCIVYYVGVQLMNDATLVNVYKYF